MLSYLGRFEGLVTYMQYRGLRCERYTRLSDNTGGTSTLLEPLGARVLSQPRT